uniref:Uncharacterized protein n=1 Tax=Noctiluca scintillans TaxID=2966 RepID=A0A7S1F9D6_NOCSC|mmetsp:Transcript_43025/g.113376  ORF Transcript_43025/g.113376 Transcript_43025/m.113376 type:complete len:107 (+) Transcript_43025:66-386(+)
MSMSLAPHPVGVKFWTKIWHENKDLPYAKVHANFQDWYSLKFHRGLGRYFYAHRVGRLGTVAPLVIFCLGFKGSVMLYGTLRDLGSAEIAAAAYGQGGYKTNPVPK